MEADYVIIGGGTAGCVLANRLSADPRRQVVVIEAGGEARNPWIGIPAGVAKLYRHPRLNWRYWTEPEPALGGRRLYWPRGRVLGGTSAINGMTFVRGHPGDFAEWARIAGAAWAWSEVLPWFRLIESSPLGDPAWRGRDGPVALGAIEAPHPLARAFLAAAQANGIAATDDYNGAPHEGIGYTQVMTHGGRRVTAASAYLAPIRGRDNLQVLTRCPAHRIVIEDGRARAVEFALGGHESRTIRARREVLVCAGTIASPAILLRSGVGDAAMLARHGIAVAVDRPAVGRNLQEHVRLMLAMRTCVPSLNRGAHGWRLAREALRYALTRRGLLASTASQVNGFVRSDPTLDRPDLQLVFRPSSGEYRDGRFVVDRHDGVMAMASLLHPASRGAVALASADPRAASVIRPGHLGDPADVAPLLHGFALLRRIFATEPMAALVEREERPGAEVAGEIALRDFAYRTADSAYHAVGTCAMGMSESAVTTPELRVRGVAGLRVVDASVMPSLPSGNTVAAVLMIAERAAGFIARENPS